MTLGDPSLVGHPSLVDAIPHIWSHPLWWWHTTKVLGHLMLPFSSWKHDKCATSVFKVGGIGDLSTIYLYFRDKMKQKPILNKTHYILTKLGFSFVITKFRVFGFHEI
jgi:hypothetical protein